MIFEKILVKYKFMQKQVLHTKGVIHPTHPDLQILSKNCECENLLGSSFTSDNSLSHEGHYFRVNYLKQWGPNSIKGLKNCFNKTNLQTKEYTFELIGVNDWYDDDDRFWEASFIFLAHKKHEKNL